MTSSSVLGTTSITMQFDLNRNIDGAARDVEAAINAARSYLPANLPSNPTYRQSESGDAPILILALTRISTIRPDVRRGFHDYSAASLADSGRRSGQRRWQLASRSSRRTQSQRTE